MALDSLPLDILDTLCQFIPTHDLLSLSLSHSVFYPSAQRYIYRHIALHSESDAQRCLSSINDKRDLARYVRAFALRLDINITLQQPFANLLAVALAEMTNLITLEVVLPPSASSVLAQAVTSDPYYARLARFSCNFPLQDAVGAFLTRTPSLKELQLGEASGDDLSSRASSQLVISTSAAPELAYFMGSSEDAALLVPNRPLGAVHLYSGELTEEVLFALARSATPITVFGALTHSLSPSILLCLASSLPHLHHLRIMTMYHSSNQPDDVSCSSMMLARRPISNLEIPWHL